MILNGNVLAEATWSRKKFGSRSGQGAEYWNERIRITEPFVEPWRLRLQATPSRQGIRDASGPQDFHQRLPLPNILGILWKYCGNILGIHFLISNSISMHFFTERGWMSHQSKKWLFLSGILWKERRKLFSNRESLSLVWFWPCFFAVSVWFNQIAFKVRSPGSQSTCTWFNQYQFHCNHARFLKKGRSLCTLTTGPNTP